MAFAFFRRRQKLVLILMVLLMVAFLIPTAIRGLGQRQSRGKVIGTADGEKIRVRDLDRATADIGILANKLGLGRFEHAGRVRGAMLFGMFMAANRSEPRLPWVLLLGEADRMGIRVTHSEVDGVLAAMGLSGDALQRELRMMGRLSERDVRAALADYLKVVQAYELSHVVSTPPLAEIRGLYRDLNEKIALGMVSFDAADYVGEAPEPSEEAIRKQFQGLRGALPMSPENKNPFGFGYRLPKRAQVSWLLIDTDRVRDAVIVPEKMMLDYWSDHRGEITREVPVPSTQPDEPADTRTVVIRKYSEAKGRIEQILRDQEAKAKVDELTDVLRSLIQRHDPLPDPYRQAYEAMTVGADDLLARPAGKDRLTRGPLDKVLASLERSSGLRIRFPHGEHEKLSIQPDVDVDLGTVPDDATVGQVLEKIRAALKLPALSWRACRGLPNVLFATEPADLLPISVGRTPLEPLDELAGSDVLGSASATADGRGAGVIDVIRTAKVFRRPGATVPTMIKVGGDYPQPMYVSGERAGRLMWRLDQALPEEDATGLTPAIRKQVIADLKLQAAFKIAHDKAGKLEDRITAKAPLEKVAEKDKLKYETTKPFTRQSVFFGGRIIWSHVPGVGIDPGFLDQAFKLVPPQPEGWSNPGPAAVVDLPRQRKVMVIQRIGYEPASEQEFREMGISRVVELLQGRQELASMSSWVNPKSIQQRVGFQQAK